MKRMCGLLAAVGLFFAGCVTNDNFDAPLGARHRPFLSVRNDWIPLYTENAKEWVLSKGVESLEWR